MSAYTIAENIYGVGVLDWNKRSFHGNTYITQRGTTYNSYLILDKKNTLLDTVHAPFTDEFIANIEEIIPLSQIDYIICNHIEPDHSGALPELMKRCPKAMLYGTAKAQEGLQKIYHLSWNFTPVKTGDTLSLGNNQLTFIEMSMIHWPDSMASYLHDHCILFSNDAFGQHLASSERFDDQIDQSILMDEAAKYYANILLPFSGLITKKLDEIAALNLPLKMLATSHGISWRQNPSQILEAYRTWASNTTTRKAVIVYETMWGSTEKMALKIAEGLMNNNVSVRLYDVSVSDRTEIMREILDAECIIIGSSTHDNDMLPVISGFIEFLKGLRLKKRSAAVFGSYGWSGGAVKSIEEICEKSGFTLAVPSLSYQYVPDNEQLRICCQLGEQIAKTLQD